MRQLPSSVYVLESHAAAPPLPPRAGRARCSGGPAQALLLALLSVALIGLVLEGLLIFYLHSSHFGQTPSPSFSKSSAEQNASPQTSKRLNSLSKTFTHLMAEKNASSHTPAPRMPLSKPVARLMDGADVVHGKGVMGWSLVSDRILRGVDYKDRSLVIRREGFYFVYSKVSFYERGVFHHAVMMRTRRHPGGTVLLLQSRKYSSADDKNKRNGDTFLAGVFHLVFKFQDVALVYGLVEALFAARRQQEGELQFLTGHRRRSPGDVRGQKGPQSQPTHSRHPPNRSERTDDSRSRGTRLRRNLLNKLSSCLN